ncbi:MAG TPA: hypothetical protein DIT54_08650 [Lachnospiraceae bacterium]|jgi:hypothetical protein|nr:hypothetical protein [Lachnospiraceae bacterium]HIS62912.1 hypothetical protein [Candidatus Scybalomonas excrementigallinarum]
MYELKSKMISVIQKIFAVLVILTFIICGFLVLMGPRITRSKMEKYLEQGDYYQALMFLNTVKDSELEKELRKELALESGTQAAIRTLKDNLQNPNEIKVIDVKIFDNEYEEDEEYMTYVIEFSLGNSSSYYALLYDDPKGNVMIGICRSLDEGAYDTSNENEGMEQTIAKLINSYDQEIGSVNIERVEKAIKNMDKRLIPLNKQ